MKGKLIACAIALLATLLIVIVVFACDPLPPTCPLPGNPAATITVMPAVWVPEVPATQGRCYVVVQGQDMSRYYKHDGNSANCSLKNGEGWRHFVWPYPPQTAQGTWIPGTPAIPGYWIPPICRIPDPTATPVTPTEEPTLEPTPEDTPEPTPIGPTPLEPTPTEQPTLEPTPEVTPTPMPTPQPTHPPYVPRCDPSNRIWVWDLQGLNGYWYHLRDRGYDGTYDAPSLIQQRYYLGCSWYPVRVWGHWVSECDAQFNYWSRLPAGCGGGQCPLP